MGPYRRSSACSQRVPRSHTGPDALCQTGRRIGSCNTCGFPHNRGRHTTIQSVTVYPWKGLYPVGLNGLLLSRRPRFLKQPETGVASVGSAFEMRATYNYRSNDESQPTNSLAVVDGCAGGDSVCSVRFQWQRLDSEGNWQNLPN